MSSTEAFVDEAIVSVTAGKGGDGLVAFRREKFVPNGGPNGGDGGSGGSVVLVADEGLATLRDQKYQREIKARAGERGGGSGKTGASGEDVRVRLPVGTLVYDLSLGEDAEPIADLVAHGEEFVAARGGRGGQGNMRFCTPTRQAPDFATPGKPGEQRKLRLSLKLLADVGLVGLPNAGKSTFLRAISGARPRVGDYPFTTLTPSLGVAEIDEQRFVVADIPGLIEGASEGVGLGDRFLRHVERTRVIVHLIDAASPMLEERDLLDDYDTIRKELAAYDGALGERREIVLLNKCDLIPEDGEWADALDDAEAKLRARGCEVLRGSGATGAGRTELLRAVARALEETKAAVALEEADAEGARA
ncbi:MAG: GTPase ObgE [Myxococcota bacterium]|nr:GTPase ObgE [Myxococcota bacterium]